MTPCVDGVVKTQVANAELVPFVLREGEPFPQCISERAGIFQQLVFQSVPEARDVFFLVFFALG